MNHFRPLSGSYISQSSAGERSGNYDSSFPSPIGELHFSINIEESRKDRMKRISVPYRGATFLNILKGDIKSYSGTNFRPLSGSYISQYHPRNPMSCLGRIGGLRGKSNFIEIQPFWKVKSSHKSSI